MKQVSVKITANFENNLEQIARYLSEAEIPNIFDDLLNELEQTVTPNLERFPQMGRLFMERSAGSIEVRNGLERLRNKLKVAGMEEDIRKYLLADYLILYAYTKSATQETLFLLSVKHHRQLSFNFESLSHW